MGTLAEPIDLKCIGAQFVELNRSVQSCGDGLRVNADWRRATEHLIENSRRLPSRGPCGFAIHCLCRHSAQYCSAAFPPSRRGMTLLHCVSRIQAFVDRQSHPNRYGWPLFLEDGLCAVVSST